MRLTKVTVQKFRNFVGAQTIEIEPDVTVLVGKNESGKTTILKALHRLNPANSDETSFNLTIEYPRAKLSRDKKQNPNLAETVPVTAVFELDESDCESLADELPIRPPAGASVTASRSYDGQTFVTLVATVDLTIRAAASAAGVGDDDRASLLASSTVDEAKSTARALAREIKADEPDRAKTLTAFATQASKHDYLQGKADLDQPARNAVWARLPKFFYFSSYEQLPGEIDLTELSEKVAKGEEILTGAERTVVALLAHAGEDPDDFLDEDYDSRRAELQAASLDLTKHVFEYWTQNPDLSVVFDADNRVLEQVTHGPDIVHRFLRIQIRDGRHGDVETNFETRSAGFQWFFSFFAAFSEYQERDDALIVLLDEPGTSLHGDAQRDFVRFVQEELGKSKQTIYSTHSAHMVDPTRYESLRAVHDRATRDNPDLAVEVTDVDLAADRDTLLPIESALGYSVSQHLFLGSGHHLAVEGSSDFVFLQRVTEHLLATGQSSGLDPRLAMIPVGGIDVMPVFVAILGRRLKVSALLDGAKSNTKVLRVREAAAANHLPASAIVLCSDADEALPKGADIEDLFVDEDYLRLFNWAFGAALTTDDLPKTGERILTRVESAYGKAFKHALPAHALTDHRDEFFATVSATTISRFTSLFSLLNATLDG